MTKKNPKYDVPSLKMGFKILEHLSHFPRGKMLTDIAEALGCPVSSAYRITMALEDMGLVVRDAESKQIRLTNKLLLTGQRAITETNLIESSLDIMREMRDRVVDTVLIGGVFRKRGGALTGVDLAGTMAEVDARGRRLLATGGPLEVRDTPLWCHGPGRAPRLPYRR